MDPHLPEYLAAAEGLADQTMPPALPQFAEDQIVHGPSGGRAWTGRILAVDGRRLHIEVSGGWLAVDAGDVLGVVDDSEF